MSRAKASEVVFMNGTIRLAADLGLENLRTKDVAALAGYSEATLFRFFETKETMLRKTFLALDQELIQVLRAEAAGKGPEPVSFDETLHRLWHKLYRYLLEHRDKTLFIIRYRYSASYTQEVRAERLSEGALMRVHSLLKKYSEISDEDLNFIVRFLFDVTLCFAEKVVTGKREDRPETEEEIWRMLHSAAEGFLRK